MKAKLTHLFQNLEVEGTPQELAEFVKALGTGQLTAPPISIPSVWVQPDACPLGGAHQYPEVWMSLNPAPCQKCGQTPAAPTQWTVTFDTPPAGMDLPTTTTTILTNDGMQLRQMREGSSFEPWFAPGATVPRPPSCKE